MHYLTVEELIKTIAGIDEKSVAGQQCLKAIADHHKGIGSAIEKYRRESLLEMEAQQGRTKAMSATGTRPTRTNLNS